MKSVRLLAAAFVALSVVCCTDSGAEVGGSSTKEETMEYASLLICEKAPASDARFTDPKIEVMESMPVQFALTCTANLPMPGYGCAVESVDQGATPFDRIVKIRMTPPEGVGLTVIDPQPVRIALGSLVPGTYTLHFLVRESEDGKHAAAQTLVLVAK